MSLRNSKGDGISPAVGSAGNEPNDLQVECTYLVVGAGTVGMSFADTILTEHPSATIVIVDKNSAPGGHWTKAYPFVRLHQPSCSYGVNSLPLGKHVDAKGNEVYDINDRATGREILEYYQRVREQFESSGRVQFFFSAEYEFDETRRVHRIVRQNTDPMDGKRTSLQKQTVINVNCRKVVTVATNVTVPSMRKPLVPVHENVSFVPVNDIPSSIESGRYNNYVVFGNGKTGVDAVTNLLEHGIDQSRITWIVSRDAWYMLLDAATDLYKRMPLISKRMLSASSAKEFFLGNEDDGFLCRLDPKGPTPEVFNGAAVTSRDLERIRSIQNVVRMGRARSIEESQIVLDRGSLRFSAHDTLLVDCMVDNSYGYASFDDNFTIFEPERINLGPPLGLFSIPLTSAVVAFLECAFGEEDAADSSKNDCCYFLRGRYIGSPEALIGAMYMDSKYTKALMEVKGGAKFLLTSRLNMNAPMHHKHGMIRMMWILYGPHQMHKFGKQIAQKVESKGFTDLNHCFGIETLEKGTKKKAKPPKRSSKLRNFLLCCLPHRHTAPMPFGPLVEQHLTH